jgi:asparagine synthase (glutamine-hydrolysing)
MYHGLEARAPFLDQELWSYAASLPPELRLRGYRLKALLRALAARRVGPEVSRRRKKGFGVPAARWLAGRWYEGARALWNDSVAEREGWVHAGPILGRLEQSRPAGEAPLSLWYLLVLELWLRREQASASSSLRSSSAAASR